MGRETKILLTLLGLLAGVFMGVVALKLFVPRPPEGTGPDIDMASEPLPLVDPPALEPSTIDPPSFASPGQPAHVASADPYAGRSSRFGSPAVPPVEEPPRDLAVVPISYEQVVEEPAPDEAPTFTESPPPPSAPPEAFSEAPSAPPPAAFALPAPRHGPVPGDSYVTRDGDSWWSLAEAAYGDGRLYRALYAWNRNLNERVSLVPGTTLDVPPEAKLGAAWSTLLPTD
jgi:hypothetical protein